MVVVKMIDIELEIKKHKLDLDSTMLVLAKAESESVFDRIHIGLSENQLSQEMKDCIDVLIANAREIKDTDKYVAWFKIYIPVFLDSLENKIRSVK